MPINVADDSNSPVKITTPLGKNKLLVESMTGEEELGQPFVYYLSLISDDADIEFHKLVGQAVTVTMELSQGQRYFNGVITEFSCDVPGDGFVRYSAVVRPWLWLLNQTADCKIFQDQTIPDIIKSVFRDSGFSDFSDQLIGTYNPKTYCVQYRESDFNFVSRLMENEGIYYYFKHEDGKHTLVLVDDQNKHSTFPGHDTVSYMIGDDRQSIAGILDFWTAKQSVMPIKYANRDYNFESPKSTLLAKSEKSVDYSTAGDAEIFDYPGEYDNAGDGSHYTKIRLQEIQCQQERLQGGGTYRGIASGYTLTLENHFRADQNIEYLVVSVRHNINNAAFITNSAPTQEVYRCQAEFINKTLPFRTSRTTRKPVVQGPQTAKVVGPSAEEIHTDKYGRVKVQFYWDRLGEEDENSSCWVRVSQVWAGAKWGAIHIPRIGQEVIVSFLEGDPDQPIITGRVYNADCMPPYDLPDNKTQSGLKTRSTKEGNNETFNELRFEDKKGEEEIYLHAEHDLTSFVENDENRTTINTRAVLVGAEDNKRPAETIESLVVQGKRLITIYGDDGLSVAEGENGRKIDIIDGNYELRVEKADYIQTVEAGNSTVTITEGESTTTVKKNITTEAQEGNISTTASTGNISTEASKGDISVDASKGKISITAATEIKLTVGSNSIKIDNSGITVSGAQVKVDGTATVDVGSPATTVSGDATLTMSGGMVKIN